MQKPIDKLDKSDYHSSVVLKIGLSIRQKLTRKNEERQMTNAHIKTIIGAVNTNKDIKWEIAENTPEKIVLTNSYDKCVKFTIKIGDEFITIKDDHGTRCDYLSKGDTRWDDYKNNIDGIHLAIRSTVNYFNNIY